MPALAQPSPIQFLPYQQRWICDVSPLKVWVKSRQIGGTFATAYEIAEHALRTGQDWLIMSRSWPQTLEVLTTVGRHLQAFNAAYRVLDDDNEVFDEDEERPIKLKVIHLSSAAGRKARIIGSPANADTARSWAGNRFFDEFAFHRKQKEIWRAAFGSTLRGYLSRVVSTPNGRGNEFYKMCSDVGNGFSKHVTTLLDAIREGLTRDDGKPIDVEAIRKGCGDEETWLQEFMCEFLDGALAWLGFEIISAAESAQAWLTPPKGWTPKGRLFGGMDVARRKHLTVIWILELLGDVLWTRSIEVLRKAPFAQQEAAAIRWLKMPKLRRFAIDATGIGAGTAEKLHTKFRSKVEQVTFTGERKAELADTIRHVFEDRRIRTPADGDLRTDLQSVKRFLGPTGHPRFDAVASETAGHGDRFWAGAMATAAAASVKKRGSVGMDFG